ncbi:MAG: hypothetical protein JNK76_08785 [Planctomycetales bacterium]|nr:hypothetical protein [Planctomycetales bacterium]MBN8624034.1 hypothetical protein [Planctomycetota bacterium]
MLLHRNLALLALSLVTSLSPFASAADLPLLVEEGFENGSSRWKLTDDNAWKIIDSGKDGKAFSLFQQSKYKPPHRSPFNIALLDDVEVTEFRLEADVLSTAREYDHRSMVMVFGYQDPTHLYYVHFGKKTDDHANQIFIVNDAPRIKISAKTTPGTPWDDNWHHVKIERNPATGDIKIYFDDMQEPVMTAVDKTFTWGKVGLGSFDDIGNWDNVKLWGIKK